MSFKEMVEAVERQDKVLSQFKETLEKILEPGYETLSEKIYTEEDLKDYNKVLSDKINLLEVELLKYKETKIDLGYIKKLEQGNEELVYIVKCKNKTIDAFHERYGTCDTCEFLTFYHMGDLFSCDHPNTIRDHEYPKDRDIGMDSTGPIPEWCPRR